MSRRGFTLIELMIVVCIVAIFLVMFFPVGEKSSKAKRDPIKETCINGIVYLVFSQGSGVSVFPKYVVIDEQPVMVTCPVEKE